MSSDRPAVVPPRLKAFLACIIVLIAIYFLQSVVSSIFKVSFKMLNQFGYLGF